MPRKKKEGLTTEEVFDVLSMYVKKGQRPPPPPFISEKELRRACDDLCKYANKIAEDHLARMTRNQN